MHRKEFDPFFIIVSTLFRQSQGPDKPALWRCASGRSLAADGIGQEDGCSLEISITTSDLFDR